MLRPLEIFILLQCGVYYWPIVYDGGPTKHQHWFNRCDSFEYLCYRSTAIRNIYTLTVRGLLLGYQYWFNRCIRRAHLIQCDAMRGILQFHIEPDCIKLSDYISTKFPAIRSVYNAKLLSPLPANHDNNRF